MADGGLGKLFSSKFPEGMITRIETGGTSQGVPDVHFCFAGGFSGWIENKATFGWVVDLSAFQCSWLDRYTRHGGRCFVAVRRFAAAGPRRGAACDELWLYSGADARALALGGLKACSPLGLWPGGPSAWEWPAIKAFLTF